MVSFEKVIARLSEHFGALQPPPAKGPFELVVWENACYLLPDSRRLEVFYALHERVGLNAAAIAAAPDATLLLIASRGGMRPETRVFRWREIARITINQFSGDLNSILNAPHPEAIRALKQFPNIGDPGAQKILLFCGLGTGLPLESNGLRVLVALASVVCRRATEPCTGRSRRVWKARFPGAANAESRRFFCPGNMGRHCARKRHRRAMNAGCRRDASTSRSERLSIRG